jgi:hypothetical protein
LFEAKLRYDDGCGEKLAKSGSRAFERNSTEMIQSLDENTQKKKKNRKKQS